MPVPPWQHCCYCPLLPHFYLDILLGCKTLFPQSGLFYQPQKKEKKNDCVYLARCLHSYGLLKAEINLAMITVLPNHRDLHCFSITREQEDIRVLKQLHSSHLKERINFSGYTHTSLSQEPRCVYFAADLQPFIVHHYTDRFFQRTSISQYF